MEKQVKATEEQGEKQREATEEQGEKQLVVINENTKKDDDGFFAYDRYDGRDNERSLRQKNI